MQLETLYKKTKTEAIQFWKISVEGNVIITEYGQVGTDSPQVTKDTIHEGKNSGRANETSPEVQAVKEATSRWQKQVKKGYVTQLEKATLGEDDIGGVLPMLAQRFDKHAAKITYPAAIQPKLDGIRCIAVLKDGKCTLWSRTRKPITSVPHIVKMLEQIGETYGDMVLDGELYNHEYKDRFEEIVSMVRQQNQVHPEHTEVQYHVYDLIDLELPFEERFQRVMDMFGAAGDDYVGAVQTEVVEDGSEVTFFFDQYRAQGYEGAMVRNLGGLYEPNRSYHLQKVKEFQDEEFPIIGITEGRGKLAGHAATFICKTPAGDEFEAKLCGATSRLKEFFENHSLWQGKKLTVQFQKWSNTNNVPVFPVGKEIRDYE